MNYKVKSLSVGGKTKVFKSGDTVCENDFHPNHAEMLLNQGHLEMIAPMQSKKIKRIGILTAIWKRHELFQAFAAHWQFLFNEFTDYEFIFLAVGSEKNESKHLALSCGFNYIENHNYPLGTKWNEGIKWFEDKEVDFVLCLGSDDFIGKKLLSKMIDLMGVGYSLIGVIDTYLYNQPTNELVYWPGYNGSRKNKIIGLGRCLSVDLLKDLNFAPWNGRLNCRLDSSMDLKLRSIHHSTHGINIKALDLFCVDIKTDFNITPFENTGNPIDTNLLKTRIHGIDRYL